MLDRIRVVFDPIAAKADQPLLDVLHDLLPMIPAGMPHIRRDDAVVTLPPSKDPERLGDKVMWAIPPESSFQSHSGGPAGLVLEVKAFVEIASAVAGL